MKTLYFICLLTALSISSWATDFTVTTKADDGSSGSFYEIYNSARNYGSSNTISFADNVDTVYFTRTFIDRQVLSDLVIDGQRSDGSKLVFYFENSYYWHMFGDSHVQLKNIEFAMGKRNAPRTFNLQSDGSSVSTGAMVSADFSNSGQLTVDNCTFNYMQSQYLAKGGGLICFGQNNIVKNCDFNFVSQGGVYETTTGLDSQGGLLYMQGALLDSCTFSGSFNFYSNSLRLKGGVAYCDVDEIKNCKFNALNCDLGTPTSLTSFPSHEIMGCILYAENGSIENCNFIGNEISALLNTPNDDGSERISAEGAIIYANNCTIKHSRINNNQAVFKVFDNDYPGNERYAKSYSTIKGGALFLDGGSATYCYVQNNSMKAKKNSFGAGVYLKASELKTSLITDNQAILLGCSDGSALVFDADGFVGGGIYGTSCSFIDYCTIVKNNTQNNGASHFNKGGGLASATATDITVRGSIFWNNSLTAGNIGEYDTYPMPTNTTYTASSGLSPSGKNNVRLSFLNTGSSTTVKFPAFMDPENGNYKISAESDCIDLGDDYDISLYDIQGKHRYLQGSNKPIDLGAYEYIYGYPGKNGVIYVSENGSGYGTSWEDAANDLAGIIKNTSNLTLWVSKGTYTPSESDVNEYFRINKNVKLYGGFAGTEAKLEQRDVENNPTLLSGNLTSGNSAKIVVNGVDNGLINGFTISGAAESAIRLKNIANCKITENTCTGSLVSCDSIINCQIFNNELSGSYKNKSILLLGDKKKVSNVTINNNTLNFSFNDTYSYGNGLLINTGYQTVTENLKVYSNTINISFNGTATDARIYGIIKLSTANNILVHHNNLNFIASGTLPNDNLIIQHCMADSVTNGTICNNNISIDKSYTDLSRVALGAKSIASKYIFNSVIWNNTANFSESDLLSYNNIGINSGGSIAYSAFDEPGKNTTPIQCIELAVENTGSDASKNYPEFSDPASGEFWFTPTSALADAGSNNYVSDITKDIIGNNRIYNSTVDIGAYEYKPYVTPDAHGIVYIKEDGTGDGSSWDNAAGNLARALPESGIQQIWVAAGTYYPTDTENRNKSFMIPNGIKVYGGFAGTESSIDERDISLNKTILSGDIGFRKSYRVVYVQPGADENTIIDGFTITKGSGDDATEANHEIKGVGVYNNGATIQNCNVTDNMAAIINTTTKYTVLGIGIYNVGGKIINSTISKNSYEPYCGDKNPYLDAHGIGMFSSGGSIENCTIEQNKAIINVSSITVSKVNYFAAGVYLEDGTINNSVIKGNYLFNLGTASTSTNLNIGGAGLFLDNSTANNCLFIGNYIYARPSGSVSISAKGGGVELILGSKLVNATMYNNFTNIITGHNDLGESIYTYKSSIVNSIIYDNTAFTGKVDQIYLSESENTIEYTASTGKLYSGLGNMEISTDNTGSDPAVKYVKFTDPDNDDYTILSSSACIDKGNSSLVTTSSDLENKTRIRGSSVDMGAYERLAYTISGTLTGADAVEVKIWGGINKNYALSDGESYTLYVSPGQNLIITPTKENYRFEPANYVKNNVNEDFTALDFTAIQLHSVVFKDWNGTELLAAQQVDHGAAATAPASNPTREHYTFTGWDVDFIKVTSDLTITAQYSPVSYGITYNLDGGTNNASNPASYTVETKTITLAAATKANHSFEGWFSEAAFTNQITEIAKGSTGDVALYAKWAINTYSVIFVDWDGTELLAAQQVDHGAAATAPASNPTREHYTFTGWDTDFSKVTSDLTVTAQYSPVSYGITYNLDGGTNHTSNPANYTIETETITLANATKANHSFEGWFSEAAFTNQITEIAQGSTGEMWLYAKWAINTYSVTFVDWDGTELLAAQQVDHGSAAGVPADEPTRTGYTFTGWDTDFSNVTSDLTVTAQYSPISYSITYDLDGGTNHTSNPENYTIETETITLADATKANYSFEGWFTEAAFTNQITEIAKGTTGNVALSAKWAINTYTVTFVDWNGAELKQETVNHGAAATAPANPARMGYTFTGWDTDFSKVTSNLTITAQYEKNGVNNYVVTFADWDGTVLKKQTVTEGEAASAPADPTRTGYTFSGWDVDFSNVSSDLTVTAQYSPISYSITYNLDGGTNDASNPTNYTIETETIILVEAAKDNSTFGGWFSDAVFSTQVTEIAMGSTGDVELFAKWLSDKYVVTFVDWNGTELKQDTVDYGSAATAPADPERLGYTFVGWDTDFSNITNNMTVTAQYTIVNYTITYHLNGGTNNNSNPLEYTIESEIDLADAQKDGYTFTGWFTDESFTSQLLEIEAGTTGDITLWAKWDKENSLVETSQLVFNVYPNPAINYLTIQVEDADFETNHSLFIIDSNGRCVKEISLSSPVLQIELRDINPGVYFAKYKENCAKFIKLN